MAKDIKEIPAPSIEDVLSMAEEMKNNTYSSRKGIFEARLDMFHGNIKCGEPKGWSKYIPPTHKRIVRWAVNQMVSDVPVVTVMSGKSIKSKTNSGICRVFLQDLLEQWERKSEISPIKECAENMMIYGMGVLKGALFDPSMWGSEILKEDFKTLEGYDLDSYKDASDRRDFYKRTKPAILLSAPDPMHIYPDLAGGYIIEMGDRTVGAIKSQWENWETDMKPYQMVEFIEYWSPQWRGYFANKEPLLNGIEIDGKTYSGIIPNVLGYMPYSWKFSGWGKSSPFGDIAEKCVSIYDGLESSITTEARCMTAITNELEKNVYTRFILNSEWSDEDMLKMTNEPASMVRAPDGVAPSDSFSTLPQTTVNPDLYRNVDAVQRDMERMLSSNARQAPYSGESALHAQVGEVREKMNFAAPLRAMEELIGDVCEKALHLVKNVIAEDVPISGSEIVIKPENIEEPCMVTVRLQTKDPIEDRQRIAMGMQLWEKKLRSRDMFLREDLKLDDPDSESAQIDAEQIILTNPEIQKALGLKGIEKLGMRDAQLAIDTMQKVTTQQGGVMPPEGMPQQEQPQPPNELQTGRTPYIPQGIDGSMARAQLPPKPLVPNYQPQVRER